MSVEAISAPSELRPSSEPESASMGLPSLSRSSVKSVRFVTAHTHYVRLMKHNSHDPPTVPEGPSGSRHGLP